MIYLIHPKSGGMAPPPDVCMNTISKYVNYVSINVCICMYVKLCNYVLMSHTYS